jgi:integrase
MAEVIRPRQFNPQKGLGARFSVEVRQIPSWASAIKPPAAEPLPIGEYLEAWLRDVVALSVRPKTLVSYRSVVALHLVPALGSIDLRELRPSDVQAYLNAKAQAGLAPRTVTYHRNVLRQALGHAERTELVSRNVARLAVPPRIPRREVRPLTPEQARTFLTAIESERQRALFLIALGVGLRQGEILGLCWPDVDLVAGTIHVRHGLQRVAGVFQLVEPKSATSRRVVPVPGIVRDALVRHQAEQECERASWHASEPAFGELIFRTETGMPIDGINVTRRFQRILRDAGLPRQRFHDLRHACASLLLSQGVPARVVMETLGHSQISLTLNTYSHVIPALGREAADRMDRLLSRPE